MDSFNFPDPLVLLLNEIDILLTQMRLFELYIKRAQAKASYDNARAHEQQEAKLASMREALTESKRLYADSQATARLTQDTLLQRVQTLENQLNEKQYRLEQCESELKTEQARSTILDEQIAQLQIARDQTEQVLRDSAAARQRLELDSSDLRRSLDELQRTFHEQQVAWQANETDWQCEIATVRAQFQETLTALETAESHLEQARREAQLSRSEIQAEAERELEQVRLDFASELARRETAIVEKDQALMQAKNMVAQVETAFQTELVTLRSQLEHKEQLIEFRDDELHEALRCVTALEQRALDLESANQVAADRVCSLELTSRVYEQEITNLRHEIAIRERALSERQEAVTAVELALHAKIQNLQQDLSRQHQTLEQRNTEVEQLRAEISGLREEIDQQNSVAARELAARRNAEDTLITLEAQHNELRLRLLEKEKTLNDSQNRATSLEEKLSGEITELRSQLHRHESLAIQAQEELARIHGENAALQAQNRDSVELRHELENWKNLAADHQAIQTSLHQKNHHLEAALSATKMVQSQCETRVRELQLQLTASQLVGDARGTEISDLKVEVARLNLELAERGTANPEIQKQFQTLIDSDRKRFQLELAALRDDSLLKEQELNNELSEERDRIGALVQQLRESEQQVVALATEIEDRRKELQASTDDSTNLSVQLDQLERRYQSERASAEQAKAQAQLKFDADLAALRQELQEKSSVSAEQETKLESLTAAQKKQVEKFELELAELQNRLANRELDLEKSQSEARLLERRIEELSTARQEAEHRNLDRAAQVNQEYELRIAELVTQLAHKDSELQGRCLSQAQLEQALRQQIDGLIREAQEKNHILQNRNDELVRVKAALDPLQERLTEVESAATGLAAAAAAESERMRSEFQAQLALLQAELSQKDWALEEREAMLQSLEQNHQQQIDSLRQQLREHASQMTRSNGEFLMGEAKTNQDYEPRFEAAEDSNDHSGGMGRFGQPRRWQTGFGWKRRWKLSETR